ncbi:MAG: alpha/beta fold hydrolase, partial [Terracoccus sp.]
AAPGGVTSPAAAPTIAPTTAPTTVPVTGPAPTSSPSPSATLSVTPTPAAVPTEAAPNPVSIQALIDRNYDGHGLTLGRESGSTSAYRQYYATYEGNGLTISGRINIPRGTGPFPAVVLAHGYVDPDEYTNGQTMLRERDYLARQGYVTLHIDYRNHAQSDDDPGNASRLRLGYTEDAITAALALQKDARVDPDRIALIGRSMGGGVVYNALVVRPGLFRAGVAYAPVSSDAVDNFNRWVRGDDDRSGTAAAVIARIGTPEAAPKAWAAASPRSYFARVAEPVLIHHGTADEECPIAWTTETVAALKGAGADVTSYTYPGQRHTFTSQWPLSIRRTAAFLDASMG